MSNCGRGQSQGNTNMKICGTSGAIHRFFLPLALAAILSSRLEPFEQFWRYAEWGISLRYYFKFRPVVEEEMSFYSLPTSVIS